MQNHFISVFMSVINHCFFQNISVLPFFPFLLIFTKVSLENNPYWIITVSFLFFLGCYGVDGESDSIMSSASENSTEPWFCDACKCGVSPSCELCPNQDGIFKETDAGRLMSHYVVFICLLYNMPGLELPFLPFMTFESHAFRPILWIDQ